MKKDNLHTIGVVIPVFNTEKFLNKCIDSILNQRFSNIQIALVDDGSNDRSAEICDIFGNRDDRVIVIHKKNEGNLRAIYEGVKRLDCEYITCVDSDDWISPNVYEELIDYVNMDIDVISYRICRYYRENEFFYDDEIYLRKIYDRKEIEEDIFPTMIWDKNRNTFGLDPSLCNKLIKKELIEKSLERACMALSRNLNYAQDVAVIYPLMKDVNSIVFSKSGFYFHRQRMKGTIPNYVIDPLYYEKTYSIYKYFLDIFRENELFLPQIEFFWSDAIEYRVAKLYRRRTIKDQFVFPFQKVDKGKNIILYGAGNAGIVMYRQLVNTGYCQVEAWVDRQSGKMIEGIMIEPPEEICKHKYDYVIITIQDPIAIENIKEKLISMGISTHLII